MREAASSETLQRSRKKAAKKAMSGSADGKTVDKQPATRLDHEDYEPLPQRASGRETDNGLFTSPRGSLPGFSMGDVGASPQPARSRTKRTPLQGFDPLRRHSADSSDSQLGSVGSWADVLDEGPTAVPPRPHYTFDDANDDTAWETTSPTPRYRWGNVDRRDASAQGARRSASRSSSESRPGPRRRDTRSPHAQEDTPKHSTEVFESASSSIDVDRFEFTEDGVYNIGELDSVLEGLGISELDREEGHGLPPPPQRQSHWGPTLEQESDSKREDARRSRDRTPSPLDGAALLEEASLEEAAAKPLSKAEKKAYALRLEGNGLYGKQDYKQALHCYLRAIQAFPTDLSVHRNLVATYVKLEKYTQALSSAEKAAEVSMGLERSRREVIACVMDMYWWQHLAEWHLDKKLDALQSLQQAMQAASILRNHNRFSIIHQQHHQLRMLLEGEEESHDERVVGKTLLSLNAGIGEALAPHFFDMWLKRAGRGRVLIASRR